MPQSARRLRFPIDHVIARQHRRATEYNPALCCGWCNRHKGPNLSGIDPVTAAIRPLYNPRKDVWGTHFRTDGARVVGITEAVRVTAEVLAINHPQEVAARTELTAVGGWPA